VIACSVPVAVNLILLLTVRSEAGPGGSGEAAELSRAKSAPNTIKLQGILKKSLSRSKSAKEPKSVEAAAAAAGEVQAGKKAGARFMKTMSLGRRRSAGQTPDVEMAVATIDKVEILRDSFEEEESPRPALGSRPISRPPSAHPIRHPSLETVIAPAPRSGGGAHPEFPAEFSRFEVPIDRGISSFDFDGHDDAYAVNADDPAGLEAAVSTFELEN